jgi:hypothetical protein
MKDAEDVVEWELDAAEFEELHGIHVDDIDTEEREAYTELNAAWESEQLDPALAQMKHYNERTRPVVTVYCNYRHSLLLRLASTPYVG